MRHLILVVFTFYLFNACKKDNESQLNKPNIVIKGTISESKSAFTDLNSSALSLSDAKKVLVFNSNDYELFNIENGTFTAAAFSGTATAVAFLDEGNKFIGCLCSGGLNVLPLVNLKDGENTIIDLSSLTLDGTSVIPANNPIGDAIILSPEEITRYKELGAYFESLSKNIDADKDGIPDILHDKQITISSLFSTQGGYWGINDTKPAVTDTSNFFINYMIMIEGGNALSFSNDQISFSGPIESSYNDITLHGYKLTPNGPQGFLSSFKREIFPPISGAPDWNVLRPFMEGTYTLTLDGDRFYSLNYSNINCKYYMILVIPTLHTNSEGNLISITLEFKLADNTIVVDPRNFLSTLGLHLTDPFSNPSELYFSGHLNNSTGFTNITLNSPLNISKLHHIDIGYTDLLGNKYDIIWQ